MCYMENKALMLVFMLLQFVLTVRFMPVQTFDTPNCVNNYHHEMNIQMI